MLFASSVALAAVHGVHSYSNGNPGWTGVDDEASSLLAVQTSSSPVLNNADPSVCQVMLFENVVFDVKEGDTVGQVRTRLSAACQDPKWGYSASLCNEVMSELFKGDDADALLDELQCPQVDGLVREHWQHQLATKGLQQRSQAHHDVTLMQDHDSLDRACYAKKGECRIPIFQQVLCRRPFDNEFEFHHFLMHSGGQQCESLWPGKRSYVPRSSKRNRHRADKCKQIRGHDGGHYSCMGCFENAMGYEPSGDLNAVFECCEHLEKLPPLGCEEECTEDRQICIPTSR